MATERISDQQTDFTALERSVVKGCRAIKANQYYIYSAIILLALGYIAFLFRGVVY